tara:strand:+ start:557 stop:820 length:264 start_codon:yes stop_codon:yes gene_type:complete
MCSSIIISFVELSFSLLKVNLANSYRPLAIKNGTKKIPKGRHIRNTNISTSFFLDLTERLGVFLPDDDLLFFDIFELCITFIKSPDL